MKVGIVGCGIIAGFHLLHILRHTDSRFVSIADINPKNAEGTGKRFGLGKIYTDFNTMLYEENPAAVHILTPPSTHAELAIKAMESGCHVLVEKPMALTVEEADVMIAASKRNDVKLCVDHNLLFDPHIMKVRELIQRGKAGRVVHVEAFYSFDIKRIASTNDGKDSRTDWLLHLPGGLLSDSLPHPLSVLIHFLNEPVRVWAVKKSSGILPNKLPDELRVLVDAGDATGSLSVSLGIKPDCFTIDVFGTEMSIHVNLSNMTLVTRKNRDVPKKILRSLDSLQHAAQLTFCTFSNAFKMATGRIQPPGDMGPVITKFYESIENNSEVPVTGEDGRAVVKTIDHIWKQAEYVGE